MLAGLKQAITTAAGGQQQQAPPPEWTTTHFQCEQPATTEEWLLSCFCTQCISAKAKSTVDHSHVMFNFCCWNPIGVYAFIRMYYGILGICGDDMCYGTFCMPCVTRQMYTESKVRGGLAGVYGANSQPWTKSLFDCTFCDICEATFCFLCMMHDINKTMQPAAISCWFDAICLIPYAMYGQVRNNYGLVSEYGLAEDLCVPVFCFPCALNRARQEAKYQSLKGNPLAQAANTLLSSPAAKVAKYGAHA